VVAKKEIGNISYSQRGDVRMEAPESADGPRRKKENPHHRISREALSFTPEKSSFSPEVLENCTDNRLCDPDVDGVALASGVVDEVHVHHVPAGDAPNLHLTPGPKIKPGFCSLKVHPAPALGAS
jgi:hypothetical protein